MDEYDEWQRTGQLELESFGALLVRLSGQIARTKSYPHPEGHDQWTDTAVQELANNVYARKKGKSLALKILEKARDQKSLELLLLTTIENVLIDEAKKTETGKLRRRLVGVLGKDGRFTRVTTPEDCWSLAGRPQEMWQGDREELVQAALSVRGHAIWSWNTAGPTPGPIATALRDVSFGVLDAAGGAVRDQELAALLRARFVHIAPLKAVSLTAIQPDAAPVNVNSDDPEDVVVLEMSVDDIWHTLSPTERLVIGYIGGDPKDWARACGLRPRTAAVVADVVIEKLKVEVVGDDRADEIIRELRGRSIEEQLGPPEMRRLLMTDPKDASGGVSHV